MVFKAVRDAITSKSTRRLLLNFALLAGSSLALLFLSILSTAIFFANYVPDKSLTWPVYLQYGIGTHPFGITTLTRPLPKTQQGYDVSVSLTLPKSVSNTQRGNFMVVLHLLNSELSSSLSTVQYPESGSSLIDPNSVIFTSRRPALVPHVDPAVSLVRRLILLPYHLLVPNSQYYAMTVKLAEGVAFPRDAKIPKSVYVEVQAGQQIQTYEASVTLTAKLRGLRWILHKYRLLSFITLTLGFWSVEMLFAAVALFLIGMALGSSPDRSEPIDSKKPYPRLEPAKRKEMSIEGAKSSGRSTPRDTASSTSKRYVESSPTDGPGDIRRLHFKEEAETDDEPTRTLREDTEDEEEEPKFKHETKEVGEELTKLLGEDTEEETKIKVENDSDS